MRGCLLAALVVVAGLSDAAWAGKKQRLDSQWRTAPIVVDGDNGEWARPLTPLAENEPVLAAAANDGEFLFIVFTTSDITAARQILRQGLTVWFDPSGGDRKHFGVKFPVGIMTEDPPGGGRGRFRRPSGTGDRGLERSSPGGAPADEEEPPNRLEIYGPQKNDVHNFVAGMAPGVEVKVARLQGHLVYELKVPLARSAATPYAIETKPGAAIGIGLETAKAERRPDRGTMGGFGGPGIGGPSGRGAIGVRRPNRALEPPKPLKTWATLQLAKQS